MRIIHNLILLLIVLAGCTSVEKKSTPTPVLTGLDGKQYFEPVRSPAAQFKLDSLLAIAKNNFEADPSEENYIWLGRREAYLYHYNDAIDIFSQGIEKFPESYKLFRHRGHRNISVREFSRAVADLQKAAALMPARPLEIEPDGQPNKLNIPLSTTQFNVWYHLGLAHYLKGDFESAAMAYNQCMQVSINDDLVCATADWMYMTLRRLGQEEEAKKILDRILDTMTIVENDSYHLRLQMYKGRIPPDDLLKVSSDNPDVDLALATQGYGVGNWYLCKGDTVRAVEIFKQVTAGKHFSSFGFIAAEAELVRLGY
jgi:tetratricopeptide (TPR) repeat protein